MTPIPSFPFPKVPLSKAFTPLFPHKPTVWPLWSSVYLLLTRGPAAESQQGQPHLERDQHPKGA